MLIDWFTVGAQALNFLILVWLMKRYLYKPVLAAIDAREKRVAAELADAAAKKAEAQAEREDFEGKNQAFDQQRAALLTQATIAAKAEGRRLLDEARRATDALSVERRAALRSDARVLNQAVAERTRREVFAVARKALADLAATDLEDRLGEVFVRRLREMDDETKEILGRAVRAAPGSALARSAFDLSEESRAAIRRALNETFVTDVHVRFETTPDLICGIELTADGRKVAWSVKDYLMSLEKNVDDLLGGDEASLSGADESSSAAKTNSPATPEAEEPERHEPESEERSA